MRIATLCGICVCLAGCGGSGTTTATPSNSVRPNVSGDQFSYSVTGTYAQSPSIQNIATTGTASVGYQADLFASQAGVERTITTILTLNSGQKTLTENTVFNSANFTLAQSDNSTLQGVTTGGFTRPTTLTGSTSISGTETLANGTTVTIQFQVTGSTSITTTAGTFNCWTITQTITFSDGFTSNETIEFAPSIGAAVQDVVHNTYSDGFSDSLTTSLTSYTLGAG